MSFGPGISGDTAALLACVTATLLAPSRISRDELGKSELGHNSEPHPEGDGGGEHGDC
jgi:hypothetical protein